MIYRFKIKHMVIKIIDLKKLSFNKYANLHWTKQADFKKNLKLKVLRAFPHQLKGGYNLDFMFYFEGRRLDRVNCFHYAKTIEDAIFKQDNTNGWIKVDNDKAESNYCILTLTPVEK